METTVRSICLMVIVVGVAMAAPQPGGNQGAIAPLPPILIGPGPVCIEEGATGFINETCQADTDCYDSSSMSCVNKRCQCANNFLADSSTGASKQRTCTPIPSLLSSCTTICQKPYECKVGHFDMGAPQPGSGKSCQCPGKSTYVNGFCDGGCKDGERLGPAGRCIARCTKDQILIDNECKALAKLGDACADSAQCTAAFSACKSGKCACIDGFSLQSGKCVPKTYSCPFGDPLKKGDSIVLCEGSAGYGPICQGPMCPMAAASPGGNAKATVQSQNAAPVNAGGAASMPMPISNKPYKTDSCPSTHYCNNYDFSGLNVRGHCCPKAPAKCPIGEPHPSASCNGGPQMCPYNTHTCMNVGSGSPYDFTNQLCCPKACSGTDKVWVKDQCLPIVEYGDGCQHNDQCQRMNGVCSGGKCTCGPKAKLADPSFGFKYCQMNCDSDEVAFGTECRPRLKLGDSCSSPDSVCPIGATCNRKSVCACICGYQKVNDKFCAPPVTCPGAPNQQNQIDAKKATFCKLEIDGKPPVPASDSCPAKSFCAGYVENMGICCPIPAPFCPDGSKPSSSTTNCHTGEKACGQNEFCSSYYFAANSKPGQTQQQGSVCCPLNFPIQPIPAIPMSVNAPGNFAAGSAAAGPPAASPKGQK